MREYMELYDGLEEIRKAPSIYPLSSSAVGRLLGFGDRSAIHRFLQRSGLKKPGWAAYSQEEVEKIWRAWNVHTTRARITFAPHGVAIKRRANRWFDEIPPEEMAEIRLCASRMHMGIGQFFRYCAEEIMKREGRSGRIPELMP